MKVVAFNGSPRPEGNTFLALNLVLDELKKEGIETELVQIGNRKLFNCLACYKCGENKDKQCARKDDDMNQFIAKMIEADGILIGSPVHFSNVSSNVKALIDRCGLVARYNDEMLKHKVGAAVVAVRRAGATFTFAAINMFFTYHQMIIPGSSYWNLGLGREPGQVLNDEEGVKTFQNLGQNMAWLLKKLNG
ncbi:MAG: flavodoxin family protein [Firmicutes bacterium]|nr:flavodoxin family protein [Bacillota bacterium]